MSPTRNQVFTALFALTASLEIDAGGTLFALRSRKFKAWSAVPADQQPALFQTEHTEQSTQRTGMDAARRFHASWTVYLRSDDSDPLDLGTVKLNDCLDAIENAFAGATDLQGKQTLGGLVYHAYIDGQIIKIPGDEDGQGMLVVPITLLVP
jgi:hypothetical protein